MRAIFFGTPEFSVPCLDALTTIAEVVRVVSQPDRPSGRGQKPVPPPVKVRAEALGIPVMQPTKVKPPELAAELRALEADVAVVVAYGRILPKGLLDAPRRGCVNVHASLLPRWRGAAPIQWSIVSGDAETGVCLMEMEEGLDTGAVISCTRTPIEENETSGELFARLAPLGAALVKRDLAAWVDGKLASTPQPVEGVTLARMLEKSDAVLDFTAVARAVHDRARGLHPWPGAETRIGDVRVKVHETRVAASGGAVEKPGTILAIDAAGIEVACGTGSVRFTQLQLEGKKRAAAFEIANGLRLAVGQRFGETQTT
jgi:methionyl-tRNA formyltransferase